MGDYNNQINRNGGFYNGISKELILEVHKFASDLRRKKNFGQRTISEKIKNNFKVNISESTISGWIHKNKIPYAQEETQFKPKPIPKKGILLDLYVKRNISSSSIAKRFNVSTIIVINWLKNYGIKVRTHKESMNTENIKKELANLKFKKPTKKNYRILNKYKSYLLGVLCGDGYINAKRFRLEIRKDEEFIKRFSDCIKKVYGIKYSYKHNKNRDTLILDVSSGMISKDLLKYGDFKTFSWRVPKRVLESNNKKIILNYLKGLYDSEGSISGYVVNFTSSSYNGLVDISKLLNKLNIKNTIKKQKYSNLYITGKRNLKLFRDLIGFTIKRKMIKLNNTYRLGW